MRMVSNLIRPYYGILNILQNIVQNVIIMTIKNEANKIIDSVLQEKYLFVYNFINKYFLIILLMIAIACKFFKNKIEI